MWRYLFILIALQSAWAAPISPCEQLKSDIIQDFSTVIREIISQLAKLLQLVVDELEQEDLCEEDREMLDLFVIIIERAKQMYNTKDLDTVFEELYDLFELDKSLELEESSELIENLLIKHGIEDLEKRIDELMESIFIRIENNFEVYVKNLRGDKFFDSSWENWLTHFRSVTDIEEKTRLFEEFWILIDC